VDFLRRKIEQEVFGLTRAGHGALDYDRPHGDPGLFGPGSSVWLVHADFTSMLVGGTSALFLQMLHPRVLAGVWDHSDFRRDIHGRLGRTAQFMAAVSFGGQGVADDMISRVRKIHDRVHGTLPTGEPYSANDPDLLAWVHATQTYCFLKSYRLYKNSDFSKHDQTRYLQEYALVARKLGADQVPLSLPDLHGYMEQQRQALRYDARAREVAGILLNTPNDLPPSTRWAARAVLLSALDNLPPWAMDMFDYQPGAAAVFARRLAIRRMAEILRWAIRNGTAHRARRRMAASS
jgi:uncharacterized protein (DUF2236 family)